jgi:hypothetical protein
MTCTPYFTYEMQAFAEEVLPAAVARAANLASRFFDPDTSR